MLPVLLTLPWLGLLAFMALRVRIPRELPRVRPGVTPPVTVVVPARNEAANIQRVLRSLAASDYPDFDIVVVDDQSDDGTGRLAGEVGPGSAHNMRIMGGADLPDGWLGKPWACAQGAAGARGEILLFTDADTVHGPDLLARSVAVLQETEADLVTVAGRQLMESFWERVVQPQIFWSMILRFFDLEGAARRGRWRDVVANGQYLLFRRSAYEALGGHEAVRDEVVEDMAFAQIVVRGGGTLVFRLAEDALATRMYRSLRELVAGWSKNIVQGGLATMPPWVRPLVVPASLLSGSALWILPPLVLVGSLAGWGGEGVRVWAVAVVALSVFHWMAFTHRMRGSALYGLFYPLGSAVAAYIFLRAWVRGRRVEWKGRRYRVKDVADAP